MMSKALVEVNLRLLLVLLFVYLFRNSAEVGVRSLKMQARSSGKYYIFFGRTAIRERSLTWQTVGKGISPLASNNR